MSGDQELLARVFPELWQSQDQEVRAMLTAGNVIHLAENSVVFTSGSQCANYVLVLKGNIRVQLITESGRQVVLYRVVPGSSCVLTTSCVLGQSHYSCDGICEGEVAALTVAAGLFQRTSNTSENLRTFVFGDFAQRLTDVIARMDQVASHFIDRRLAQVLLTSTAATRLTHQQLAAEIGRAREVVSRHLKRFEAQNLVRPGRGTIEITAADELRKLCERGCD